MEEENIAIRLKVFIDSCGLSHSQFADKCGIPRPTLSQVLSGRNKKISDVIIGQIHRTFPELSVVWLLFAEGSMLNNAYGDNGVGSGDASLVDGCRGVPGENAGLGSDNMVASVNTGGSVATSLFPDDLDSIFSDSQSTNENNSNVRALNKAVEAAQLAQKQLVDAENKILELQTQIDKMRQNPRSVTHITIYYDDSTFETFSPKS